MENPLEFARTKFDLVSEKPDPFVLTIFSFEKAAFSASLIKFIFCSFSMWVSSYKLRFLSPTKYKSLSGKEFSSSSGVILVASTHLLTRSSKFFSLRLEDEIDAFFLPINVVSLTDKFSNVYLVYYGNKSWRKWSRFAA